jgi:S1-C subfamily serine protease
VRRTLAALATLAVLAGCGGGGGSGSSSTASKTTSAQTQSQTAQAPSRAPARTSDGSAFDAESIYRNQAPGVVTLFALQDGSRTSRGGQAVGSGFVIDDSGHIATNAHVITSDSGTKAKQVYAQFADGNRLPARILGTDLDSDVGLVKIDPSQLRPPGKKLDVLSLGSTGELKVGDPVAAIGSPFGEQQSLSVGVVSALGRDIQSLTNFDIGNAIQTDAAINHGNSGGPLLDAAGRVIGINSQIRSTGGGGEGVGFAIPVETVKRSIGQLRDKGHVDYAYLGISSVSLFPQLAQRLGIKGANTGALVDNVSGGGPADRVGLHRAKGHITFEGIPGIPVGSDLITAVDGRKLSQAQDLSDVIGLHQPGDSVELKLIRDNKPLTVTVKLGKRPGQPGAD